MLSTAWVWQFEVQVFINETGCMREVVVEVVCIHEVVVDEHSAVYILWLEIEANIVPVRWPDLVVIGFRMSEIGWNRKR